MFGSWERWTGVAVSVVESCGQVVLYLETSLRWYKAYYKCKKIKETPLPCPFNLHISLAVLNSSTYPADKENSKSISTQSLQSVVPVYQSRDSPPLPPPPLLMNHSSHEEQNLLLPLLNDLLRADNEITRRTRDGGVVVEVGYCVGVWTSCCGSWGGGGDDSSLFWGEERGWEFLMEMTGDGDGRQGDLLPKLLWYDLYNIRCHSISK